MFKAKALLAAATLLLSPLAANAASINLGDYGYNALTGAETPIASDTGNVLFILGPINLNAIGNNSTVNVTWGSADLNAASSIDLLVSGMGVLTDTVGATAVEFLSDSIEVLFENLSGSGAFAGNDGGAVLVTIDAPGFNPLLPIYTASSSNFEVFALTESAIAPIPLPAGLPLVATGLLGLGLLGRRRKAS